MIVGSLEQTMKLGEYLSSGGQKAAIEGSTHYGRSGDRIAAGLAEVGTCARCTTACLAPDVLGTACR